MVPAIVIALMIACSNDTQMVSGPGSMWRHGSVPVDDTVIQTIPGASHCDEQSSTFLVMGWPLGTSIQHDPDGRWYVRDPTAFLRANYLTSEFKTDVTPPVDATYTQYRNDTFELWLAPSDQDAVIYMKVGRKFERWPRATQPLYCQ